MNRQADPVQEALEQEFGNIRHLNNGAPEQPKTIEARLDEESLKRLKDLKPPKDTDAFVKVSAAVLILIWIVIFVLSGLEIEWLDNGKFVWKMQLDATFKATLTTLATTAAGVILNNTMNSMKKKD